MLPSGYKALKYIEGDGSAYIDTGFKANQNTSAEVEFSANETPTNIGIALLFGSSGAWANASFGFYKYSTWYSNYNSDTPLSGVTIPTGTKAKFYKDKNLVYIDDTLVYTHTEATFQSSTNLLLGKISISNQYGSYAKYYTCKIWDNGTLTRDLVPAERTSDNAIGMYDTVTNQFFGNAGSGVFTAGPYAETIYNIKKSYYKKSPILPTEYTQLEYIQSSGTQYIDTGAKGSNNTKVEEVLELLSLSSGIAAHTFGDFTTNTQSITMNLKQSGYSRFGDASLNSVFGTLTTDKHTYGVDKNGYSIDGVITTSLTGTTDFATVGNLFWMSANYSNSVVNAEAKYYELKLWENNILVRNLIPACNRNTNVLGMYDLAWDGSQYGSVDMGTMNWNPIGNGCFYAAITNKANGRNIYCTKYETDKTNIASATANMHIGGHEGNRVYFRNTSIENTRAAAQADLSGVMLYYQRTDDPSWASPWYTNAGTGTFIAGNPVATEICVKKNYYANRVLPSGYTELEYIQSSGTQYIDTGVNGTNKTAVWTATAENLSSATNTALISGGYAQTVRNCYGIFIYNDTWSTYGTGSVTATGKQNIVSTTIINTSGSTSTTIVVDDIQSSEATRIYDSSHDMNNTTLFASKLNASTMTSGGNFKLYSASCSLDDVLVRNFIPAQRISDSVIGMYDTVTNTFFANAGTGSFTAGPAKTSYTICEIKKSHYFIGG